MTPRAPDTTTATTPEERREEALLENTGRLRAVVGRLSRRLRPTKAGAELTPSEISVLFSIVRREQASVSRIAEAEGLNPTMLSRIVAQLSDAGLVYKEADPADRRAAFLGATAAGRRMRERIHRERTRALLKTVEQLDERKLRALWAALPVLEELAERLPGGSL